MLEIRTTPAVQSIQQHSADMRIETKPPRLEISKEQIKVQIDQSQCFNEAGLMNSSAWAADAAQRGAQAAMEAISKAVSEGDSMAAIENGGGAIASLAFSNSFDIVDYNITTIPKSRPKVDFVGGNLDIRVDDGFVNIQVIPQKPQIDVQRGSIEIDYIPKQQAGSNNSEKRIDTKI